MKKSVLQKIFLPTYDEGTFLCISITIICTALFNLMLSDFLLGLVKKPDRGTITALILILIVIFIVYDAIYQAFTKRKKESPPDFTLILNITAVVNIVIGITAIHYIEEQYNHILIIFPLVNLVHSVYTLIVFRYGSKEDNDLVMKLLVDDRDIGRLEAILGVITTVIVFLVSHFYLLNHWIITMAICITYGTMLNRHLTELFTGLLKPGSFLRDD